MKSKNKKKWLKIRKQILKAITAFFAALLCISCGTTKAVVTQPKDGSYTQITITTNNPISTDVRPETNATLWERK